MKLALHGFVFIFVLVIVLSEYLLAEEQISIEPVPLSSGLTSIETRTEDASLRERHPELFKFTAPSTPFLHAFHDGRKCGYLFYNQADISHPSQRYVVQRVKRTVRDYEGEKLVNENVDYLVEAIRLDNDRLKAPDRHFGVFSVDKFTSREVVKEFEIGTPIDFRNEDDLFGKSIYVLISDYQPSSAVFDKVAFQASTQWTMSLKFSAQGDCAIKIRELGIQLSCNVPEYESRPQSAVASTSIAGAHAGIGVGGVQIRKSRLEDAVQQFGEIIDVFPQKNGAKNVEFGNGVVCHTTADGSIKTISLVKGFTESVMVGGVTVRLGDSRDEILQKLGPSLEVKPKEQYMTYRGLAIWLEGDVVVKLVIW